MKKILLLLVMLPFFCQAAMNPSEFILPPEKETVAEDIFKDLRCPVCAHQALGESDADIAKDLRLDIRHRLQKGEEKQKIIADLRAIYGDEILLTPPLADHWLLWVLPAAVFIVAVFAVGYRVKKRGK